MMYNFNKIKWFNPIISSWVIDYIGDDNINPFVISFTESTNRYNFVITKQFAKDIYILLENALNSIVDKDKNNIIKIINLSINSQDSFVSGQFEIIMRNEMSL